MFFTSNDFMSASIITRLDYMKTKNIIHSLFISKHYSIGVNTDKYSLSTLWSHYEFILIKNVNITTICCNISIAV